MAGLQRFQILSHFWYIRHHTAIVEYIHKYRRIVTVTTGYQCNVTSVTVHTNIIHCNKIKKKKKSKIQHTCTFYNLQHLINSLREKSSRVKMTEHLKKIILNINIRSICSKSESTECKVLPIKRFPIISSCITKHMKEYKF